jgi:hypothetical protein
VIVVAVVILRYSEGTPESRDCDLLMVVLSLEFSNALHHEVDNIYELDTY